jgi:hypothetical protein
VPAAALVAPSLSICKVIIQRLKPVSIAGTGDQPRPVDQSLRSLPFEDRYHRAPLFICYQFYKYELHCHLQIYQKTDHL